MTLEIVIPETNNEEKNTKDMVFSILIEDEAKTLTQLHREIKRRYKISVSFQAVIKAVNSLLGSNVLTKKDKLYSINKDWIFEARNFFDNLYTNHFKVKKPTKKIELSKEIAVYTLRNLLELDRLWNDLLTNWAKNETQDKKNCWKGCHAWWLLPRLQEEDILHDFMIQHGIKTYNLWTQNTPLDKLAAKYYLQKREYAKIKTSSDYKKDAHIAAFGNNLIKFEIPLSLSKKLERVYKNTKKIQDLNIKEVIDIFKENVEIDFVIIKDKYLADKVKNEIIRYWK